VAWLESQHAAVLELFAAQAAVSLETARLYAQLIEENEQRRAIEIALRASEATLLQAEKINHSGSFAWEIGAAKLRCSAEFCRLFDFDPAQSLIGASALLERVHADDRERVRLQIRDCVAHKRPIRIDYRLVCDGTERYLSSVAEPMGGDGEAGMYVGTALDLSERRAAEYRWRAAQSELARARRMKMAEQLTASIVHQLSQPLMSIAAHAGASLRWLERDPPRLDQLHRGLVEIAAQSQRAGSIMHDLQARARRSAPDIGNSGNSGAPDLSTG
jgi:PAS domain S-box-containing protein